MLQPAEVRPFLSHEDGFVRALALSYLAVAHDRGQATQDDLWTTIDRYGEAPKAPKEERRRFARNLPDFPATERSIERLLHGLSIEPDDEVKRHLLSAAEGLPAEAMERLLGDARTVSRIPATATAGLREAVEFAGMGPDDLWEALGEQASRLGADPTIRPIGGRVLQASTLFQRAARIVRALARHATRATELGLRALGEPRHPHRTWDEVLTVMLFTRMRLPELEGRLVDLAVDGTPELTSVYAGDALVRLGTPEVVEALVDRCGERHDQLLHVGVDVLPGIKRPEAEAVLLRLFEDVRSAGSRPELALHLCEMGTSSPTALEALEKMARVRSYLPERVELVEHLSALKIMLGLLPGTTRRPR